ALDIHHQSRETRIAVSAGDDFERLQQRHAGLEHGCELAGRETNVLFIDAPPAAERLLPQLDDADSLPSQIAGNDRLRGSLHLSADVAIAAVEALPEIGE